MTLDNHDKKHRGDHASSDAVIPVFKQKASLEDCQLQVLYDGSTPLTAVHKICLLAMRAASAFGRHRDRLRKRLAGRTRRSALKVTETQHRLGANDGNSSPGASADTEFAVGDLVRVRPIDEIRSMADSLVVFDGMEKFCGNCYRVAKKVTTMFEPSVGRSIRLKNTYLLDGVHCDGRRMYSHEGCNRCCYFFWKGAWLQKVPNEERSDRAKPNHTLPSKSGLTIFSFFKPGDTVKVRSLAEIEGQLDESRRTGGLEFMQGMKKVCGQQFTIKAKMQFLINEETNEMRHLRNAYILDGVACDGHGITRPQRCERACLYVWHRDWLTKI